MCGCDANAYRRTEEEGGTAKVLAGEPEQHPQKRHRFTLIRIEISLFGHYCHTPFPAALPHTFCIKPPGLLISVEACVLIIENVTLWMFG